MAKLYIKKSDGTYVPQKLQSVTNIDVVQTTGNSITAAMSQDAVTKELAAQERTINGLKDQVNNYKPIEIFGNVTNAADEEDITTENGLLKFKNRSSLNGRGYVILRKDKTFEEQVTQANTIYVIRYDFTLGKNITVPENCVLEFEGGSISNHKLICSNTRFINPVLKSCSIAGTIIESVFDRNSQSASVVSVAFASNGVTTIDLQGASIEGFPEQTISSYRTKNLVIKNGELHLNPNMRFGMRTKDVQIELNNIRVIASGKNSVLFMEYDLENDSYSNEYVFNNCRFENELNVLSMVYYGTAKSLTFNNCNFKNTSVSTINHGRPDLIFTGLNRMWFSNCYFEWDTDIEAADNADCIALGGRDNIFITGCTFRNIKSTCIDVYGGNRVLITKCKFINVNNGVELKSIYRDEEYGWQDGKGTGEYELCPTVTIDSCYFEDCTVAINTPTFVQCVDPIAYLDAKFDLKQKLNLIITNNSFFVENKSASIAISRVSFKYTLISNNIFTFKTSDAIIFDEDRELGDRLANSVVKFTNNIVNYENGILRYGGGIVFRTPMRIEIENNTINYPTFDVSSFNQFTALISTFDGVSNKHIIIVNTKCYISVFTTQKFYLEAKDSQIFALDCAPRPEKSDMHIVAYNSYIRSNGSDGYFGSANSVMCLIDCNGVIGNTKGTVVLNSGSYIRSSAYDYRASYNRKLNKPFADYAGFVTLEIPYRDDYVYELGKEPYYFKIDSSSGDYYNGGWINAIGLYDFQLTRGTTTERQSLITSANRRFFNSGFTFYDTDLKKLVLWDGNEWRNTDGSALS